MFSPVRVSLCCWPEFPSGILGKGCVCALLLGMLTLTDCLRWCWPGFSDVKLLFLIRRLTILREILWHCRCSVSPQLEPSDFVTCGCILSATTAALSNSGFYISLLRGSWSSVRKSCTFSPFIYSFTYFCQCSLTDTCFILNAVIQYLRYFIIQIVPDL